MGWEYKSYQQETLVQYNIVFVLFSIYLTD